jgi:hypothetical protein
MASHKWVQKDSWRCICGLLEATILTVPAFCWKENHWSRQRCEQFGLTGLMTIGLLLLHITVCNRQRSTYNGIMSIQLITRTPTWSSSCEMANEVCKATKKKFWKNVHSEVEHMHVPSLIALWQGNWQQDVQKNANNKDKSVINLIIKTMLRTLRCRLSTLIEWGLEQTWDKWKAQINTWTISQLWAFSHPPTYQNICHCWSDNLQPTHLPHLSWMETILKLIFEKQRARSWWLNWHT